jgi:hypothetical protein
MNLGQSTGGTNNGSADDTGILDRFLQESTATSPTPTTAADTTPRAVSIGRRPSLAIPSSDQTLPELVEVPASNQPAQVQLPTPISRPLRVAAAMEDSPKPKVFNSGWSDITKSKPPEAPKQSIEHSQPEVIPVERTSEPSPLESPKTTLAQPREPVGMKMPRSKPRRGRSRLSYASFAILLVVFASGAGLFVLKTNVISRVRAVAFVGHPKPASAVTSAAVIASPATVPSEVIPAQSVKDYRVADDNPELLTISKINVSARIMPQAPRSNAQIQPPTNIYDTSWDTASAKPVDPISKGPVVISGYTYGPTMPGVFADIDKLVVGDQLKIQIGEGIAFNYSVVKIYTYDATSILKAPLLNGATQNKPGLNIIGRGGTQFTVVYAVL